MNALGTTPEEIVEDMPSWFLALTGGKRVFGIRKDKLLREILALGGMDSLEQEFGLSFNKDSSITRVSITFAKLVELKRRLCKQEMAAVATLAGSKDAEIAFSELKGGPANTSPSLTLNIAISKKSAKKIK